MVVADIELSAVCCCCADAVRRGTSLLVSMLDAAAKSSRFTLHPNDRHTHKPCRRPAQVWGVHAAHRGVGTPTLSNSTARMCVIQHPPLIQSVREESTSQ